MCIFMCVNVYCHVCDFICVCVCCCITVCVCVCVCVLCYSVQFLLLQCDPGSVFQLMKNPFVTWEVQTLLVPKESQQPPAHLSEDRYVCVFVSGRYGPFRLSRKAATAIRHEDILTSDRDFDLWHLKYEVVKNYINIFALALSLSISIFPSGRISTKAICLQDLKVQVNSTMCNPLTRPTLDERGRTTPLP